MRQQEDVTGNKKTHLYKTKLNRPHSEPSLEMPDAETSSHLDRIASST